MHLNRFLQLSSFSKNRFRIVQRIITCITLEQESENLDYVEFHLPVNDHGQATMSPHASDTWQNQEIQKVICKVVRLDDFEPIKELEKLTL